MNRHYVKLKSYFFIIVPLSHRFFKGTSVMVTFSTLRGYDRRTVDGGAREESGEREERPLPTNARGENGRTRGGNEWRDRRIEMQMTMGISLLVDHFQKSELCTRARNNIPGSLVIQQYACTSNKFIHVIDISKQEICDRASLCTMVLHSDPPA